MNTRADTLGNEFPKTSLTLIRNAANGAEGVDRHAAWRQLIDTYSAPIRVVLARYQRRSVPEAVDDFFGYLYAKEVLDKYDEQRAPFRCFIQLVARRFVYGKWRKEEQRREPHHLDDDDVPENGQPTNPVDVEWARTVMAEAWEELEKQRPRDAELVCRRFGLDGLEPRMPKQIAEEHGTTPGAVSAAIHAALRRLGDLIRAAIRVQCPDDATMEAELAVLLTTFESPGVMLELALSDEFSTESD